MVRIRDPCPAVDFHPVNMFFEFPVSVNLDFENLHGVFARTQSIVADENMYVWR